MPKHIPQIGDEVSLVFMLGDGSYNVSGKVIDLVREDVQVEYRHGDKAEYVWLKPQEPPHEIYNAFQADSGDWVSLKVTNGNPELGQPAAEA